MTEKATELPNALLTGRATSRDTHISHIQVCLWLCASGRKLSHRNNRLETCDRLH